MYVIIIEYLVDFDLVQNYLADHREYLKSHYQKGNLVCSGPQEPLTGGMVISKFKTKSEVDEFICNDPFFKNEIASYKQIKFSPVLMADQIKEFLVKDGL